VEAGAHSFACITGRYRPLTRYYKNGNGDLAGEIELPLAIGTVGGATRTKPEAKIALKILGVKTAKELSEVIAAVGLAQNFAALRALATEGIQKGHMRLHAKNVAVAAGAKGDEIDEVSRIMVDEKDISAGNAKKILDGIREKR
jgi:hydroxymethylglutaryl-CoA reductase